MTTDLRRNLVLEVLDKLGYEYQSKDPLQGDGEVSASVNSLLVENIVLHSVVTIKDKVTVTMTCSGKWPTCPVIPTKTYEGVVVRIPRDSSGHSQSDAFYLDKVTFIPEDREEYAKQTLMAWATFCTNSKASTEKAKKNVLREYLVSEGIEYVDNEDGTLDVSIRGYQLRNVGIHSYSLFHELREGEEVVLPEYAVALAVPDESLIVDTDSTAICISDTGISVNTGELPKHLLVGDAGEGHYDGNIPEDVNTHSESEVSNLALRLLGAMYLGFRIEQSNGHRYIIVDTSADYFPDQILTLKELGGDKPQPCLDPDSNDYDPILMFKEYGSVTSALDRIDSWFEAIGCSKRLHKEGKYYFDVDPDTLLQKTGVC